ncbi:MAG: alpha-glucuronidase family glycosyl hydrolase, partial [Polyangiaceae bacterium]
MDQSKNSVLGIAGLAILFVFTTACSSKPAADSSIAAQAGQSSGGSGGAILVGQGGSGEQLVAGSAGSGGAPTMATAGASGTAGASETAGASGTAGTSSTTAGEGGTAGVSETYPTPVKPPPDEDGSALWLRYPEVPIPGRLAEYRAALKNIVRVKSSKTMDAAQAELVKGLSGLTGADVSVVDQPSGSGAVVLGTPESSTIIAALPLTERLAKVGAEGYVVEAATSGGSSVIAVAGNTELGVLRGTFALLRHLQSHRPLNSLALSGAPKIQRRVLNHWDNMDGTIERGYAGRSLWSWSSLPATISQRYIDYARANASLGINGAVLNNVNSNAQILSAQNLDKVAALATAFRPYGIAVYLSARFSAPMEIGGLTSADPGASAVKQWWVTKVNE